MTWFQGPVGFKQKKSIKIELGIGKIYFFRIKLFGKVWENLVRIKEKESLYYHFDYLAGNYPPEAEEWKLMHQGDLIPGVDILIEVQPSELPLYMHLPYKTEFFDSALKS